GTNVDHVAREVVVNRLLYIGADLSVIAAVEDPVNAVICDLIRDIGTAVTQDATRHMQLDLVAYLVRFERSAFFLIARVGHAMRVGEVLKITFAGLIADRAIEGVIEQQEL